MSRCIGSIHGNILLSEINPRWAPFNPLTQAAEWFELVSADELRALESAPRCTYDDAIDLLHTRTAAANKKLVIRDWTQVDFIPGRYPISPVYRLTQYEHLKERYTVNEAAIVRDPVDTYLSLTRLPDFRGWLGLDTFLAGYRFFIEALPDTCCVRYEDFCESPENIIRQLSSKLCINYNPDFMHQYEKYDRITGETHVGHQQYTLTGDSIDERAPGAIQVMPKRPEYEKTLETAQNNEDYIASLEIITSKLAD